MKGKTLATCLLSMLVFVFSLPAAAGAMTEAEILDQLKTLRAEQNRLNEAIGKLERALGQTDGSASGKSQEQAGKAGLADRVLNLEKKLEKDSGEKWTDRITLSGVLEVEAGWEKVDYNDPDQDDETARDMTLATVELGVEARIADHVTGSFVLLWQEGETDGVDLDEGYILIDGEEACPFYLAAGKMCLPFGSYASRLISDPLTLQLGETSDTALKAGFHNDLFDFSAGIFTGGLDREDEEDRLNHYFASLVFTLPEEIVDGLGLTGGVSFLSSIMDTNGLREQGAVDNIAKYIRGAGVFLSASWRDKFFLDAEYISALDEFEAGELGYIEDKAKPAAWSLELAVSPIDALCLAVRYEGSRDGGDFLAEKQYGASVSYSLFENTSLALEYLRGIYENDDASDALTAKLAVEF